MKNDGEKRKEPKKEKKYEEGQSVQSFNS